jgi:lysophospholipase L1-like esterase
LVVTTAPVLTTDAEVPTTAAPPATPSTLAPVITAGTQRDLHTSCTTVLEVGDSLSYGTVAPEHLPIPSTRQDAQFARVGAFTSHIDAVEARAIVEYKTDVTSGIEAATALRDTWQHGCWVIALGTNDAANIAKGNDVSAPERIARMMAIVGDDPVLWVNAKTLETDGDWAEPHMLAWNAALDAARLDYPNLRVFDWASAVQDSWFLEHDRVHLTREGYVLRARLIANALAVAFPA